MIKVYYNLTKPGIIYGNAITAAAGFFLASKGHINWFLFLAMLAGISLVIASACVLNNVLDRDIDDKMERTKHRALVTGVVPPKNAIIYGTILGLAGVLILIFYTNILAAFIGFAGFFVYITMYTPLKRQSIYGTLVGAVAGAVPPVVGYTAVTNNFDLGALLLFLILIFWQMPHFYAIAIYRFNDYSKAGIPVLPVKKGIFLTKINMLCYIIGFITTTALLTIFKFTGYAYLGIMFLFGLAWLVLCLNGFKGNNGNKGWGRKMFFFSLIVLLVFSFAVSIGSFFKIKL